MSQGNFAREVEAKQTTYSSWERGIKEPGLDMLIQISRQFGVSTDWLLGLSNDPAGPKQMVFPDAVKAELQKKEEEIKRLNGIIEGLKMALAVQH